MKPEAERQFADLTERYLNGTLSDERFGELEAMLLADGDARALFLDLTHQHAKLRLLDETLLGQQLQGRPKARVKRFVVALAAAAAVIAISLSIFQTRPTSYVATLVSSEDAMWESPLPTTLGSRLGPDFLRLKSGVATIRFDSGAEVVLEAPAHLVLETPMRGRLLEGVAVVTVPEPATGFVMATPYGVAVDHGTQFAVSVDTVSRRTLFEVLSGEISVHHESSGEVIRLRDSQMAAVTADGIGKVGGATPEGTLAQPGKTLRLKSDGLEASIIRDHKHAKALHKDMLMMKTSIQISRFDRRAVFGFPLAGIDLESVQSAALRLNLVPTGLGSAARMATSNTFVIYALPDEFAANWNPETLRWSDLPKLKKCRLVATLDIPRSRQRGSFRFESPELLDSLKNTSADSIVFLAIRETHPREYGGLVHAFACSTHPEASGPSLELSLTNQ